MELTNMKHDHPMRASAWFLASFFFLQSFLPTMVMARDLRGLHLRGHLMPVLTRAVAAPAVTKAPVQAATPKAPKKIVAPAAIPGGPDQPEVKSFTPIGTSEMVNAFTGDFSYNIPLMDVDGYPINLAYDAGVTMDQEASWVGLGWNLNPGVVNRVMRGIPDDFNGADKIVKEMSVRDNFTVGVSGAVGVELFGIDGDVLAGEVSLSAKLGINYNNYNGFGAEVSITPGLSIGKPNKSEFNVDLGFTGSSTGGATISPSVSLATRSSEKGPNSTVKTTTKSMNIGTTVNSRGGLGNVSMQFSRKSDVMTQEQYDALLEKENGKVTPTGRPFSSSFNTGMSTYVPTVSMPMSSGGGTFSVKLGADLIGFDGTLEFEGYFSKQWLKEKSRTVSAYGYMNLQNGQTNPNAQLDFNRENDGAFTKNTPALAIPSITYDLFNVSGQGISGSYRAQRPDIGYVFDPEVSSGGFDGSLGLEAGLGGTFKAGIDLAGNYSTSNSSVWENNATDKLRYSSGAYYFREANEMSVAADPTHFGKIGGDQPVRFNNPNFAALQNILEFGNDVHLATQSSYLKSGKDKRNQVIYTLSYKEMQDHLGVQDLHALAYVGQPHHLAQFTTLNDQGVRYVYGIAAYNKTQKDVSFATEQTPDPATGLIAYSTTDASSSNSNGMDHYFNSVTTPAYAHSFLLTSILNPDYMDIDNVKGPSAADLGGYTKFSYKKVDNYKWRSPAAANKASYDEGLNTDQADDKGHYIYGEKELWYVEKIETKNHIAVFTSTARRDGRGVNNEQGGISSGNASMLQLDRIDLYSLADYNANPSLAVPLKTVTFVYNYNLCKDYPQNLDEVAGASTPNSGKLTLEKIFFTYQGSQKGRYTPYVFHYDNNPNYDIKSVDRWGNYKPKPSSSSDLQPSDYPYVGYNKANSDNWAGAWNLNRIDLPSGGKIQVIYEADDYAYVQHLKANQMLKIVGVELPGGGIETSFGSAQSVSNSTLENAKIYFELVPGYTNINDYTAGLDKVYFRSLMKFQSGFDYVPGYAEIESSGITSGMGWLKLKPTTLKDNGPSSYNPMAVAGVQFGRLYLSRMLPPSNQSVDENASILDLAEAILGAFVSFGEAFTGPNKPLWEDHIGTDLVIGKSWVRLNNPDKHKLGGGHRVKEIRMYDAWEQMTTNTTESFYNGQRYKYLDATGTMSSGVAAYEPQVGADENPWRQPIANDVRNLLAPDTRNYQETPFGEQFFPGAMVGYSRVEIVEISGPASDPVGTGKVVKEFYTAKEFPTLVNRTSPQIERLKLPVFAFFFSMCIDEMSASQGFVVETNDMHGKPKSEMIYAENQSSPITKIEYAYQSELFSQNGAPTRHLTNNATVIEKDGTVATKTVGLTYEAVADFRKSTSLNIGGTISGNINFTIPFILVPTIMGSGSLERTAFRSASFTKVIERFGIMTSTKATDLGSEVETNNLAYDAETGIPLLTQTTTNFNDKVYNFTYPAHWYYDGMGQAYKSIDVNLTLPSSSYATFSGGVTTNLNKGNGFAVGDEIAYVTTANAAGIAWVVEVTDNSIKAILRNGDPLNGTIKKVKVLRSGRRNLQNTSIGSVSLQTNPLTTLTGNVFDQVLQAGAIEYSEDWRTFCECYTSTTAINYSINPYVLGLKGNWRPKASYTHLSMRTQEFENNNSDIRNDGQFVSYRPFYKLQNGKWAIDKMDWTYASSVTEFSPEGQALETVDALNRFSASQFGFNQTLTTAAAVNTRYSELGFDSFEDFSTNCTDNHFRLGNTNQVINTQAHTGRKSIKVTPSTPVVYVSKMSVNCEPAACNMTTTAVYGPGDVTYTMTVVGGVAPYTFEFESQMNITNVTLTDAGDGIIYSYDGFAPYYSMRVIITDSMGCTIIRDIAPN